MLRTLLEGYADAITLATMLRPPLAKSASQGREVAPERELRAAAPVGRGMRPVRRAGRAPLVTALSDEARIGLPRILRLSRGECWAISFVATAASTYALDGVATAAGVVLVASGLLGGLDQLSVLLLLAGTYVLWGAGLRVNLAANWALLENTGTSTNVLSKSAYELAKLWTRSARARRIATAAGYAGTELAKEGLYYAGAFGVALLSDTITSHEAIIFLAGSNLGAGAYEYGLARAVRAFLQRMGAPAWRAPGLPSSPRQCAASCAATSSPQLPPCSR